MARFVGGPADLRLTWLAAKAAGTVSARLAARPAGRLWFMPWRVPVGERAQARRQRWLADVKRFTVAFGDRELAAFSQGSGPTVLLVHGWGDESAGLGAYVAPLVGAGFRVVGVDLPAHGASPGRETNLYEMAEAVDVVADAVGGVDAIVAHSIGGAVTTYALAHGLAVNAVALLAPAVRLEHAVEAFGAMFGLPPRTLTGLRRDIDRRFGADVWASLAGDLLAPQLRIPAVVVHDRDDPQVAFADGERLAAAWPAARLIATEGLGHHRILRDETVINEVVNFLGASHSWAVTGAHGHRHSETMR